MYVYIVYYIRKQSLIDPTTRPRERTPTLLQMYLLTLSPRVYTVLSNSGVLSATEEQLMQFENKFGFQYAFFK